MEKIELPKKGNVVIIGYAATGKTTFSNTLKFDGSLYHTDDYIPYGFEQALYVLMDDLKKDKAPLKVIEGILGYRLLRKGLQLQNFYADLVIVCEATKEVRYDRIKARNKDVQATFNLDNVCRKIWSDYEALWNSYKQTRIITIKS
jgi:deoxyadenosine/deoxycytidine kinase